MLKDYLFLLLLLIVIPHAKKEPKNTFVFVENKMSPFEYFYSLNKQAKIENSSLKIFVHFLPLYS